MLIILIFLVVVPMLQMEPLIILVTVALGTEPTPGDALVIGMIMTSAPVPCVVPAMG